MITIGAAYGGGELADSKVDEAVSKLVSFFRSKKDEFVSLNFVFHVPGSICQLPYSGVRTAKFSRKQKMLMIQISVPEKMKESELLSEFLFKAMREGIEIAKPKFEREKIEYPVNFYLGLLDQAQKEICF